VYDYFFPDSFSTKRITQFIQYQGMHTLGDVLLCIFDVHWGGGNTTKINSLNHSTPKRLEAGCANKGPNPQDPAVVLIPEGQKVIDSDLIDIECSNLILQIGGVAEVQRRSK